MKQEQAIMRKIFYSWISFIFLFTTPCLWSQTTMLVSDENHNVGIDFKYLGKLKSGLAVSWVVYSHSDKFPDARREEDFFWVGTLDAFTFTNISIVTAEKDGTLLDKYTMVWGRRNGAHWQANSYEKGIVDIESNPTAQRKRADDSMLYQLTNVLTMGFGLHWDVNSMRFGADGKVTGKEANFPDSLEGQITHLPNGQIQKFFYSIPLLGRSYLLDFSYRTENDRFPSGFELSQAIILPNGEPYAALQLKKIEILNISDITPDVMQLAGVPAPALSENALISNNVTIIRSSFGLIAAVFDAAKPKSPALTSESLRPNIIRLIILAVFSLPPLIMIFMAIRKRVSK